MDASPFTDVDSVRAIGQIACHLVKLGGSVVLFIMIVVFFRSLGQVDGSTVIKRPRLPSTRPGGPVNERQQPVSRVPPLGGRTRTH